MSSPSLRQRGSLRSSGDENVDHQDKPAEGKVMKAGPPSRANTATTDELEEEMISMVEQRSQRGVSDASGGSFAGGSDSEGWTEEQEANYRKMRAAFEEDLEQRKQGEDWLFVFAFLGFLVCGTIAAFVPKFVQR